MAICTVSGNFTDPQGNGVVGATVRFNIENPVLDSSGNLITPTEVDTTTTTGGAWSLALTQGVTGILTIDLSAVGGNPIVKYTFSVVIPDTSTATFASVWADAPGFSSGSQTFPLYFTMIAGQLATDQLPILSNGYIWIGNASGEATPCVLSGDATLSNSGTLTLTSVNSNVGTYTNATVTVNAKGLITAASNGSVAVTTVTASSPLASSGGTAPNLSIAQASSSTSGYLSSTDWSTFNSKQASGNYITALTGDGTASGPGSPAFTLATVNSNTGTFASATYNAKGLATAAANLSGDLTTSGSVATLATVNSNVGTFGSSTTIPIVTVNAKGLVTAVSTTIAKASFTAPTVQKFTSSSGTYTTPTPTPLYIRVRAVGGGGGGGGSSLVVDNNGGNGGTGGNTTFGTSLIAANGGAGGSGTIDSLGGTGGSASLGSGPVGVALSGGQGGATSASGSSGTYYPVLSANGGSSAFGGAGGGGTQNLAGGAGSTNTGGGGGGGGSIGSGGAYLGAGGGSGGFVDAIITSPSSTYAYAVGGGGSAGSAGTSGYAGGVGGSGIIIVEEFYQ